MGFCLFSGSGVVEPYFDVFKQGLDEGDECLENGFNGGFLYHVGDPRTVRTVFFGHVDDLTGGTVIVHKKTVDALFVGRSGHVGVLGEIFTDISNGTPIVVVLVLDEPRGFGEQTGGGIDLFIKGDVVAVACGNTFCNVF